MDNTQVTQERDTVKTTVRRSARAIDTSILLVWADMLNDESETLAAALQEPKADSGPARRLEILMAEACAAGVAWRTIVEIFIDWIGVIEPQRSDADDDFLASELFAARCLLLGELPSDGSDVKRGATTIRDQLGNILYAVSDSLAYMIRLKDASNPSSFSAWTWTVEALALVHEVGGDEAIDKCVRLARARLFGLPVNSEARCG